MDESKEVNKEPKRLTVRQEAFCWNIARGMNQTEAAIKAGYSKNRAKEQGSENVTKRHLTERIDEIKSAILHTQNVDNELIISHWMILLNNPETSPAEKIKILVELGKYSGVYEADNNQKKEYKITIVD